MLNKLKQKYQDYKKERQLDVEIKKQLDNLADPVFIERVLKHEDRRNLSAD